MKPFLALFALAFISSTQAFAVTEVECDAGFHMFITQRNKATGYQEVHSLDPLSVSFDRVRVQEDRVDPNYIRFDFKGQGCFGEEIRLFKRTCEVLRKVSGILRLNVVNPGRSEISVKSETSWRGEAPSLYSYSGNIYCTMIEK